MMRHNAPKRWKGEYRLGLRKEEKGNKREKGRE